MVNYSLSDSLGTLLFVFGGGVTVGWLIVSQYMKKDMQEIKKDDEENRNIVLDYVRSYYDDFEALEEKDHTEDFLSSLKDKWIIEDTPFGEIIMTYRADQESFWYYGERRNIPYRVLDTVARKFAIDNNCKSICINYKEEFEKGKSAIEEAETNKEKSAQYTTIPNKISKKPLAVFKSYNMKKTNNIKKKYIITENANRFTYKGHTSDWQDPKENPPVNNKITYSDFINRDKEISSLASALLSNGKTKND